MCVHVHVELENCFISIVYFAFEVGAILFLLHVTNDSNYIFMCCAVFFHCSHIFLQDVFTACAVVGVSYISYRE